MIKTKKSLGIYDAKAFLNCAESIRYYFASRPRLTATGIHFQQVFEA